MGYNKNNFKRIREEYATKHLIAERAAEEKRRELHRALPEVARIDTMLAKTGLSLMGAALADKDTQERRMAELREENRRLNQERDRLLIAAGYPANYSDIQYECPACSDSGYVGIRMCECMKKALTLAGFESSGEDPQKTLFPDGFLNAFGQRIAKPCQGNCGACTGKFCQRLV